MLDFVVARQKILEQVAPLPTELIPVADADGRVLGMDLISDIDLPGFDYSAMDGYAVASSTLRGDGPWSLRVSVEQRTGSPALDLPSGTAARIFTGAALPLGADSVVMQEDAERDGDHVLLRSAPRPGNHVRRRGEDLARHTLAVAQGTRLNPFWLGLLAALDQGQACVFQRPRVTLLCTGDELRDPGSSPRPGSIPDSNGPSLAALARRAGANVGRVLRSGDELSQTRAVLRSALAETDVLLTVGGVSVGDHDVVKRALEEEGVALDFWKVKIKPGKPLAFGRRDRTFVLGLPGNPVSAQLTLALFGLPLLRALQGDARPLPSTLRVRLAQAIAQKPGRLGFYRARLDGDLAHVHANQASGAATSMAAADALLLVPADTTGLGAGDYVEALRIADL